jgi:hypothetical protein
MRTKKDDSSRAFNAEQIASIAGSSVSNVYKVSAGLRQSEKIQELLSITRADIVELFTDPRMLEICNLAIDRHKDREVKKYASLVYNLSVKLQKGTGTKHTIEDGI